MAKTRRPRKPIKKNCQNQNQNDEKAERPPSWEVVKSLFTCKDLQIAQQQELQHQQQQQQQQTMEGNSKRYKKMGCSGSLCSNTRVMHRPESSSPEDSKKWGSMRSSHASSSSRSMKAPLREVHGVVSSSTSSSLSSGSFVSGSFKGMPFRRLSGCYECRMVVDPVHGFLRDPALRTAIFSCSQCGEIFMKAENLEHHQAVRHAVSELDTDDTSRNIVEIIFQSSWLKKQAPVCKIDRILKVQNSQKTITRFEDYRDSIKAKANKLSKKHPRCVADGNELLRFHCTTFMCSIGLNGSTNLCNSIPNCNICSIIKNGFKINGVLEGGICTTSTSGKAHDNAHIKSEDQKRAMLVCRVIAGRVKKNQDANAEEYDSVAGPTGQYSNLDELYVFNPKAILPCFVVIYGGF